MHRTGDNRGIFATMGIGSSRFFADSGAELKALATTLESVFDEIVARWRSATRMLQNTEGQELAAQVGNQPRAILDHLRAGRTDAFLATYRELIILLYRQGISLDQLMLMVNAWEQSCIPIVAREIPESVSQAQALTLLEKLYHELFVLAAATFHGASRTQRTEAPTRRPERLTTLTRRERQILSQIGNGMRTKEIATQLGVSIKTVEAHRTNLMRKLGVTRLAHLVRYSLSLAPAEPPLRPRAD